MTASPAAWIDGQPANAADLASLAFAGFAHFTAMQVRDGRVRGLDLHLGRLRSASLAMFGRAASDEIVRERIRSAIENGPANLSLTATMFSRAGEFTRSGATGDPAILVRTSQDNDGPEGPLRLALVDAGFNNLARPILYGAYHPMAICPADGKAVSSPAPQSVVVGGPLCESGDIFTQGEGGFVDHRALPAAKIGDFLIIGYAGAYGYVMANNYNSKPLVAEVLIENGQTHLIRARQSLDDLTRGEVIPKISS